MKLRVKTHSGKEFIAVVDTYDPIQLNQEINSNDINTVVIGDTIISRIDIKIVEPLTEQSEEEPIEDDLITDNPEEDTVEEEPVDNEEPIDDEEIVE